jgi:predicted nuclease of predicted toxin-antitoxin system
MPQPPLRFKIDENLPTALSEFLRESGFDSTTLSEPRMSGVDDGTLASVCQREGRTLVTLDVGFGDVRLSPPAKHSGIVILGLRRTDQPWVLSVARSLVPALKGTGPFAGQLWIVTENEVGFEGQTHEAPSPRMSALPALR